ncbi:galectin-4-like [Rhinichthys klamathensis goyatoka]|uniref:galectin-4-like n=1 Tax=Rhinichthys klamathensis goyatoka TaxID=3034132 RepID=UPI0024B5F9A1|nr:galectin-4-like [Rhinichthys klamathensis goyatoka]
MCFETQNSLRTPKRNLGTCPHSGRVVLDHQIYVNGKEQYTFKHRIPLEKVSAININGDVDVNLFGFIQNWSTSSFHTEVTSKIISLGSSRGERSTVQSEILQPVQNPILPYAGPISGGLREGMALYLQGVVPTNADRFAVNFKTGSSKTDDTAFHFNPRMGSNVAMNSFRDGKWESAESVSDNPFKKGEAFKMFMVIKSEGYQIYVNGKEQYTFKHRIPLEKVSALNINGDVAVNLFGFIQNWSTSSFHTEVISKIISLGSSRGERSTVQSEILQPVQNPILPYAGPISGGLREGMALYLQGVVPTNADRFAINFKTGSSKTDDTAFHFNPRMGSNVTMNSFRNGGWESEESVSDNPFKKGEAFEMFMVIKSEGYQIYVNGKEQYTFKHRIPLEKVSALNINGDVAVKLLGFIQDWSTSSFVTKVKSKIISLGRSRGERSTIQSEILQPVQNPSLPYVGPISGGLRVGMALYVQGVVPTNADRFSINFKTGPTDKHDIAFHFNPRMGWKVAMNSSTNGKWGAEESVSNNPFKKGEDFEMFFIIKSEGYQVQIKGQQHSMFKHRIPLEKVTTIHIHGNVSISFLGFVMGM